MKSAIRPGLTAITALSAALLASSCANRPPMQFAGAPCERPPLLHCQDRNCPSSITTHQGSVVETQTGRTYFLDYPCDLMRGEKVTLILSLHGGGSYGNWHRNYLPLMDYVDKYRLVVATPNSRGWTSTNDEAYLQNIATSLIEQIGAKNVEAFWLAGHSAGSAHTRRMVCDPFYRDKVDGVLTLGGGRIGSASSAGGPPGPIPPAAGAGARPAPRSGTTPPGPPPGGSPRAAAPEPVFDCDFSFIFAVGEHEAIAQTLPTESSWAKKHGCNDRRTVAEIADTSGGLVWDPTRQPGNDAWGHEPRGGTAKIMRFPDCRDGRVVADIVRLDKGHTEGVEPKITEEIVRLMKQASGGKLARS